MNKIKMNAELRNILKELTFQTRSQETQNATRNPNLYRP